MVKYNNWFEPFRSQKKENVYILTVSITEEHEEIQKVQEVIDCLDGELGIRYAHNLLCRLADEILAGTEYEETAWEISHGIRRGTDRSYEYIKRNKKGYYAEACLEWVDKL